MYAIIDCESGLRSAAGSGPVKVCVGLCVAFGGRESGADLLYGRVSDVSDNDIEAGICTERMTQIPTYTVMCRSVFGSPGNCPCHGKSDGVIFSESHSLPAGVDDN
jgi:hypothetical protein